MSWSFKSWSTPEIKFKKLDSATVKEYLNFMRELLKYRLLYMLNLNHFLLTSDVTLVGMQIQTLAPFLPVFFWWGGVDKKKKLLFL